MYKKRYLTPCILEDLEEKMVFIGGARQVGKTTLSRDIVSNYVNKTGYFNWDLISDRRKILNEEWPADVDLLIFDEFHKYRNWKNLIKGFYDKWSTRYKIIVTGSARLDVYRKGGDSLQGRYHHYRLHPFTLAECLNRNNQIQIFEELSLDKSGGASEFDLLLKYGGFPEPITKQNNRHLRRWHQEKLDRMFREDVRDLESIRDLSSMKLLSDLLPARVGSLLSLNSLREDLFVSHRAISHWVNILEEFFYHYRIYPYTHQSFRSLKKEPKMYLWDWSEVEDKGARFENFVGSHLLKLVHFLYDYEGYNAQLYYLRDKDKREVDFLVTIDQKPWFACEVKMNDEIPSKHLKYFQKKLNIPFLYQIVMKDKIDHFSNDVRVISASKFLANLI